MAKPPAPDILVPWMAPFAACFTRPTWHNVLVLVAGARLDGWWLPRAALLAT